MNLLHRVAGIDQEVMKQCPGIDRIWATQLGLSLLIGFCFVFTISYYSIGYFVTYEPAKIGVALIIAAVVGLFDRALFQSDWYYMGLVQQVRDALRAKPAFADRFRIIFRYMMRIVFRLGISLLIAYTLSLFVEIAVFGDAISEKIQAKFNVENQEFKRRLQDELNAIDAKFPAIEQRISRIVGELGDRALRTLAVSVQDDKRTYDRLVQQIQIKESDIATLRNSILENDKAIREWSDDVEAERRGVKLRADHTGRPGCGAVCQTKLGMIANAQAQNAELRGRQEKIAGEIAELEKQRAAIAENYERADAAIVEERKRELAALQQQLTDSQAYRASRLREKEQELKQIGLFTARLDDPIIRVKYLKELKEDPERGEVVTEISLMIRLFIMFLEIAPVIGKMFFSPPSAYAFKIRANVGKEQIEALALLDAKVDIYQRQHDANLGNLDELIEKRRSRIEASISLDQAKADYFKRKQNEERS